MIVGIKSTALRFATQARTWLGGFAAIEVGMFAFAGEHSMDVKND